MSAKAFLIIQRSSMTSRPLSNWIRLNGYERVQFEWLSASVFPDLEVLSTENNGLPLPWLGELIWDAGHDLITTVGAIYCVFTRPSANIEDDFNLWYDTEHVPRLCSVPGCLGASRYYSPTSSLPYLALYLLRDTSVQQSTTWKQAMDTPWRHRIMSTVYAEKYMFIKETTPPDLAHPR